MEEGKIFPSAMSVVSASVAATAPATASVLSAAAAASSGRRKRKGVSPLIAAVLLIAMTMVIAATLTVTVTRLAREPAGQAERGLECTAAAFAIDKDFVQYDANNRLLRARLRNFGTSALVITEYSAVHSESPADPVFRSVSDPATNTRIDRQQSIIATFNVSNATGGGTLTRVRFETNCAGVVDEVASERYGGVWPSAALDPNRTVPATIKPI